jgi:hypothetical protein
MKDDFNSGARVCNIGYHFSRFRAKDWHRLYIENLCGAKSGRSAGIRVLKLKGLYFMGILLMAVGFLICFNAIYRAPVVSKRESAAVVSSANIETGEVRQDLGSHSHEGQGD